MRLFVLVMVGNVTKNLRYRTQFLNRLFPEGAELTSSFWSRGVFSYFALIRFRTTMTRDGSPTRQS
jgi:hypothetical protein